MSSGSSRARRAEIECLENDAGPGIAIGGCRRRVGIARVDRFTRLLKGLLFGISASDPRTFVVIAVGARWRGIARVLDTSSTRNEGRSPRSAYVSNESCGLS